MASAEASSAAASAVGSIGVELVYCPGPGQVDIVAMTLPGGTTVAAALQASGLLLRHQLATEGLQLGIWCKACSPDATLRDRDRIEIYRALQVDPKEARRLRYKRSRGKGAQGA